MCKTRSLFIMHPKLQHFGFSVMLFTKYNNNKKKKIWKNWNGFVAKQRGDFLKLKAIIRYYYCYIFLLINPTEYFRIIILTRWLETSLIGMDSNIAALIYVCRIMMIFFCPFLMGAKWVYVLLWHLFYQVLCLDLWTLS